MRTQALQTASSRWPQGIILSVLLLSKRQVVFTGNIPQVRIQVTVLQINKQDQRCLLALILIQFLIEGKLLGLLNYHYYSFKIFPRF